MATLKFHRTLMSVFQCILCHFMPYGVGLVCLMVAKVTLWPKMSPLFPDNCQLLSGTAQNHTVCKRLNCVSPWQLLSLLWWEPSHRHRLILFILLLNRLDMHLDIDSEWQKRKAPKIHLPLLDFMNCILHYCTQPVSGGTRDSLCPVAQRLCE